MKVYVMTDLEGVAGVINFDDYATPEGKYYEVVRELTTMEVNSEALNIDTSNFYWYGYWLSEVEEIFERLTPLTVHTKNGTTERKEERRGNRRDKVHALG